LKVLISGNSLAQSMASSMLYKTAAKLLSTY
jgi:hypothetical protein